MLPSFVITLREGVEAALIIGIIAAFLAQQGDRRARRAMWLGVGLAAVLCLAGGIALQILNAELPEEGQEILESSVTAVAVGMVTFMIVWMRRNARHLSGRLRGDASDALASGSMWALIAMAFFAVLREGFETAVFLVASFQASSSPASAGSGALLGLAAAITIGWALYRGGLRLNLNGFFRATSVLLVIVAAGLVATTIHTGLELGWVPAGGSQALDLGWLVRPDTVSSSLLTGMLGLRPQLTVAETAGWLIYAVPMLVYVLWPTNRRRLRRVPAPQSAAATSAA